MARKVCLEKPLIFSVIDFILCYWFESHAPSLPMNPSLFVPGFNEQIKSLAAVARRELAYFSVPKKEVFRFATTVLSIRTNIESLCCS
jgi:hypothetical protein